MTVLIATYRLPATALLEAREACKTLGLATADWIGGLPRFSPSAVISGIDHGARRIPDDVMALLEANPGIQVVLCAQEPLVKPRVVLGDGRVSVVGPPIARAHIAAALRAALPPAIGLDERVHRRFEALRRSHWIAWARGGAGPAISLHEQGGATVVIGGPSQDRAAIAEAMASSQHEPDLESTLGTLAGNAGVMHLAHDAGEWVVYWPYVDRPLWLYSPHRIPTHWNAARGIAAVAHRRVLRLPAFPADQLVAAWSDPAIGGDALAQVQRLAPEGGSQTLAGLDDITARHAHVTGLVMEVR